MINTNLFSLIYSDNNKLVTQLQETPEIATPIITQSDVENRFFSRYFVRPTNEKNYVVEVDNKQYSNFKQNPRFNTVEVKWKIVGKKETIELFPNVYLYGVEDVNRQEVISQDLTFGGLREYITNYTEFWFSED